MILSMGGRGLALALVLGSSPVVLADDTVTMDHQWPAVPADRSLSMEDQITEHLSELGNLVGSHIDLLSHDMIGLHVNARENRARLRLGGGDIHYLTFRIDSAWL